MHPLRLLLDQNIVPEIAVWLRMEYPDWDTQHVADAGLSGAMDRDIYRFAQGERRIVITFDEDFADARMFPLGAHHGVIRLRVWPTTVEATKAALTRLFTSGASLPGNLVIVDNQKIRVRSAKL